MSSVSGQHYISLQTPRDFQSFFPVFLSLTSDGYPFILSPNLSPNAWWLLQGLRGLHQDAVEDLRDSNTDHEGKT